MAKKSVKKDSKLISFEELNWKQVEKLDRK